MPAMTYGVLAGDAPAPSDDTESSSPESVSRIEKTFSLRGVLAGVTIGVPICFASIYYGLQAGRNNSMPLPSALLGYAITKPFERYMRTPFSPMENVLTMTVAASMGGMPTTAGLSGIIPALEYLLTGDENGPLNFTLWRVILWSLSVCLFGVMFAAPFREHFILRSNLRFPTGTAMAAVIGMLHKRPEIMEKIKEEQAGSTDCDEGELPVRPMSSLPDTAPRPYQNLRANRDIQIAEDQLPEDQLSEDQPAEDQLSGDQLSGDQLPTSRMINSAAMILSSLLSLLTCLIPNAKRLPIFGPDVAQYWAWSVELSLAYVGYGMIMDPLTTGHMLIGAVIGWGILSPLAKTKGWAPGPVESWVTGSQGWTIWVALGIILGDSLVGICWTVSQLLLSGEWSHMWMLGSSRVGWNRTSRPRFYPQTRVSNSLSPSGNIFSGSFECSPLLPRTTHTSDDTSLFWKTLTAWSIGGSLLCFLATWYLFHGLLTSWQLIISIIVIFPLGVASIRSMGETDNSLASSLGKVSQFFFALFIHRSNPNAVIASLLVGGIAEGGSYQSSDVMEHFKTGNLVGASPKGLFFGQIVGSVIGAIVGSCVYKLLTSVFSLPSENFPIPNAQLWLSTVHLIYGRGLPTGSLSFSVVGFMVSAACATVKITTAAHKWSRHIPSGIAVGIGIYMLPAFTIPQALGGLAHSVSKGYFRTGELSIISTAVALVLGDTLINLGFMIVQSFGTRRS